MKRNFLTRGQDEIILRIHSKEVANNLKDMYEKGYNYEKTSKIIRKHL